MYTPEISSCPSMPTVREESLVEEAPAPTRKTSKRRVEGDGEEDVQEVQRSMGRDMTKKKVSASSAS
ncbi:hypothetical protein Tco_1395524 [Tanacetum coccineum]